MRIGQFRCYCGAGRRGTDSRNTPTTPPRMATQPNRLMLSACRSAAKLRPKRPLASRTPGPGDWGKGDSWISFCPAVAASHAASSRYKSPGATGLYTVSSRPLARIASDRAKFSEMFVKRGLSCDVGGFYRLPSIVGPAKAAELLFTGRIVDAREALAMRLVSRVVPHDELLPTTLDLAASIAALEATLDWAARAANGAMRSRADITLSVFMGG